MDIRLRVVPQQVRNISIKHIPMQFHYKKTKLQHPTTLVVPTAASNICVSNICEVVKDIMPLEENETRMEQIEQHVKQQQQIVSDWDEELEMLRVRDLEMRRTDVIRELDTLIAVWWK